MGACPADETLAAFVERRGERHELVEEHIDVCAACRALVAHIAALRAQDPAASRVTVAGATATGVPPTLASNAPAPHSKIARYVVERELGRGGMGIVLLAHDPQLDRKVAVKLVRRSEDLTARTRLVREARAMARLSHPNVVTIHDVGELPGGEVFLAMEVVHGPTLRAALLGPAAPSPGEVVELFVQAGRGLAAAHAVGLVHRDFKPENVLIGPDGRVRVTDFGLARGEAEAAAPALTAMGFVVGTPAYMAPEQHIGVAATDRADQFAFCVALFEALTGERPHPGTSLEEISDAKLRDQRRPWPAGSVVPPEIRAAIDRGLMRDPAHRFASMNELLAILERHRFRAAPPRALQQAVPVPMLRREPPRPPAWPTPARGASAAPPRSQDVAVRKILIVGGVVAALCVVLIGGSCLYRVASVAVARGSAGAPVTAPPTAEEAVPTPVPAFRAVVANPTLLSRLPCPNGTVQRTQPTTLTCVRAGSDDREGPALTFYASGKLREQLTFHLDKREGRSFQFAESGALEDIADYVDGQRDGLWMMLSPQGRLRSEYRYRKGKEQGVHRLWSTDDGRLIAWERFEDGRVVERKQP